MSFIKPENTEALEDINNILKYAYKGYYIFTTKTASMQYDVIEGLNLENVFIFDYSKDIKPYSYDDLVELININPEITKFIILNFHLALQEKNDIFNLNLSRDILANQKKLWIFGMTEDMDNRLARTAFDFYSYVMMKVRFKEEKESETIKTEFITGKDEIYDKELAYSLIRNYENSINTPEDRTPEFLAQTYSNMANLYRNIADYKKALEYYNKALGIREKVYGKEHPDTAISYNNLGAVYRILGYYEKALGYYNKALAIKEKVYGVDHPSTATSYNNMGEVYDYLGDYDKALEYCNKALEICEKVYGDEHPHIKTVKENIERLLNSSVSGK